MADVILIATLYKGKDGAGKTHHILHMANTSSLEVASNSNIFLVLNLTPSVIGSSDRENMQYSIKFNNDKIPFCSPMLLQPVKGVKSGEVNYLGTVKDVQKKEEFIYSLEVTYRTNSYTKDPKIKVNPGTDGTGL
ncbi:MAG: hypothetical protein ABJF04_02085 [Reichenbachiella sp.]|uniref:hypothetical protein n=1 Tax=Reichenbachiella sp. TaxID=2184521 RepID=UPI00326347C4